ncbi:MAG TPA: toll/interleukin-1 receptor domain-containing protein, partial [Phototrophicaceae bacterium]|nr:toll/interleukin-1 receptor domain-containing protein [Phototrophicaceae bacterium]
MPDVFISYSRKDKEFVRRLVKRLADQNYDVWVDFEDIPAATDWWAEICQGIEGSHTTLYVISPDSLESEYCGL